MGWKGKYQQSSHSTWQKSLTVASKATTSVVFYVSSCIPRLFLALPLRLSLFLDTKQAQNCHHHTNQPPKTQTITTPLLLYLKLNHHTTTIAKIQETHTQNHHHQTPGQTHTQTHHHQIRETHTPKSITTTAKIHQAHGDGERDYRKEKWGEKKKKNRWRKKKKREKGWMVMKEKNETEKEWRSDKGARERKRKEKVEKERERGKSMKVEIQTLDIAP